LDSSPEEVVDGLAMRDFRLKSAEVDIFNRLPFYFLEAVGKTLSFNG
jgi:hypothetical protein